MPFSKVLSIIVNQVAPYLHETEASLSRIAIVWEIRLPRTLLAGMVGAGLAVVGCALQSVTRNPLADPHLLGISSGGALGAITALLHTGLFLGILTVPLLAFIGALTTTFLVLGIVQFTQSTNADRLILTGVAVSFIVMAIANLLIFVGDPRSTHTVVFWMLGGLGLAQWNHLLWPAIVLCFATIWLFVNTHRLNIMILGDETASTLGISARTFRLHVFVVSALITGVMVAFSGIIGFVGLMVPHITRLIYGGNHLRTLPFSMLFGAIFLIWADIIARTLMTPDEIPIGIVTGLIGGLFFIYLLWKSKKST